LDAGDRRDGGRGEFVRREWTAFSLDGLGDAAGRRSGHPPRFPVRLLARPPRRRSRPADVVARIRGPLCGARRARLPRGRKPALQPAGPANRRNARSDGGNAPSGALSIRTRGSLLAPPVASIESAIVRRFAALALLAVLAAPAAGWLSASDRGA